MSYTAEDGTAYTKSTDRTASVTLIPTPPGKEHTAALELFTVQMESNDAVMISGTEHEAGERTTRSIRPR